MHQHLEPAASRTVRPARSDAAPLPVVRARERRLRHRLVQSAPRSRGFHVAERLTSPRMLQQWVILCIRRAFCVSNNVVQICCGKL